MADLYESDEEKPAKKATPLTAAMPEETPLERLRKTISAKVERPMVLLEVPDRPEVCLRISPNITQKAMKAWRKNAGEDTKKGLDPTIFAAYVIGHTTIGIEINNEEVFDEDGHPLNFASADILSSTQTTRPVPDAVLAFFNTDPHVESAALAILEAAGYGETVDTVDPTTNS